MRGHLAGPMRIFVRIRELFEQEPCSINTDEPFSQMN